MLLLSMLLPLLTLRKFSTNLKRVQSIQFDFRWVALSKSLLKVEEKNGIAIKLTGSAAI
jgi:hypothetical protein